MPDDTINKALEAALAAAAEACWILRQAYDTPIEISMKGPRDLVTDADLAAEKAILDLFAERLPDIPTLSEEDGGTIPEQGLFWVIDPLDGTTNFAHRYPMFCTSIALAEPADNEAGFEPVIGVVANPLTGDVYHAVKGQGAFLNGKRLDMQEIVKLPVPLIMFGFHYKEESEFEGNITLLKSLLSAIPGVIRRGGSAALDAAFVSTGRVDLFLQYGPSPWDVAAAILIVREAGGRAYYFSKSEAKRSLIIAADAGNLAKVVETVSEIDDRLKALLPAVSQ